MDARPALVAALFCGMTSGALAAGASLSSSYAPVPYAVASSCDLAKPLVSVNLTLRNTGDAPTVPMPVTATDSSNVFSGETMLPPVAPAAEVGLQVPLRLIAANRDAIGGAHVIIVRIGTQRLNTLTISVPATLCGAAAATAGRSKARTLPRGESQVSANGSGTAATIAASLKPAVPSRVRSIADNGGECVPHLGLLGALVCPDLIKSGDLLLVWDWRAGDGPDEIDGFRVYRVDSGLKQLVYTRANKKDLTLADIAKPRDGYAGKCYAVSAYVDTRESVLSPAFCAAGGSVAQTMRLAPAHARSTMRFTKSKSVFGNAYGAAPQSGLVVGFHYFSSERLTGDQVANEFYRSAIAFDVTRLANHRLVAAKLYLKAASLDGSATACATDVGMGAGAWWLNDTWIEGRFDFGIYPSDGLPLISADVTPIVGLWLRGAPNYGFVLKNADENSRAFTNKTCETRYSDPILEITYY